MLSEEGCRQIDILPIVFGVQHAEYRAHCLPGNYVRQTAN
jgi:hypothetical protein